MSKINLVKQEREIARQKINQINNLLTNDLSDEKRKQLQDAHDVWVKKLKILDNEYNSLKQLNKEDLIITDPKQLDKLSKKVEKLPISSGRRLSGDELEKYSLILAKSVVRKIPNITSAIECLGLIRKKLKEMKKEVENANISNNQEKEDKENLSKSMQEMQ